MVSAPLRSTLLTVTVVLVLLGGVSAVLMAHTPTPRRSATPTNLTELVRLGAGEPVYPFTATAISGRRVSLHGYGGRPLVITFFASWCAPCADDAGVLRSVAAHYRRRVAFLAVAAGDTVGPATAFARRYRWTWPVVVDGDYQLTRQFHVVGTPMTVVVDSRGRVTTVLAGAVTSSELTATLRRLVA